MSLLFMGGSKTILNFYIERRQNTQDSSVCAYVDASPRKEHYGRAERVTAVIGLWGKWTCI